MPFVKDDPRINREGRPKGSFSLVEMLRHKLQEIPEGKDKTYAAYFIEQIMKKTVLEGDVTMMKDMIDRIDGKPIARTETDITTGGEQIKSVSAEVIAIAEEEAKKRMIDDQHSL